MLNVLILMSFYFVLKVVFRIIAQQKCIDEQIIQRYVADKLSAKERNRTIAHLGICEKCRQKIDDFNFGNDLGDHLIDRKEDN